MINFIVLGSGCSKCVKTAELIQKVAAEHQSEVSVVKETDPAAIMSYDVMSTPAVVINGILVHSGSIPTQAQIAEWLIG